MAQLVCEGRFYRGYNMKLGDSGQLSLAQAGAATAPSSLCLFKFYPATNCRIRLRCPSFSVARGYSSTSCPRKLVTKADSSSAQAWCGDSRPPALSSAGPMLVGYMALVPGSLGGAGDRFRCSVSCVRQTPPSGGSTPGAGSGSCRCGQAGGDRKQGRVRKRKRKRKITRKYSGLKTFLSELKSKVTSTKSKLSRSQDLTRIIGGTPVLEGSVPWQASLAVSGD